MNLLFTFYYLSFCNSPSTTYVFVTHILLLICFCYPPCTSISCYLLLLHMFLLLTFYCLSFCYSSFTFVLSLPDFVTCPLVPIVFTCINVLLPMFSLLKFCYPCLIIHLLLPMYSLLTFLLPILP